MLYTRQHRCLKALSPQPGLEVAEGTVNWREQKNTHRSHRREVVEALPAPLARWVPATLHPVLLPLVVVDQAVIATHLAELAWVSGVVMLYGRLALCA